MIREGKAVTDSGKAPSVKWYVGATSKTPYCVFKSAMMPSNETHGCEFLFCFGPYKTKREAVQVAMYQTHGATPRLA